MKFREQNQNKIGVDSGADLGASYHVVFLVVNHLVLSWFPSGGKLCNYKIGEKNETFNYWLNC